MKERQVMPIRQFNKTLPVPGDKSITHRAVMFNAATEGEAVIRGGLLGEDCISTINCMRALGSKITISGDVVRVTGTGRFADNTTLDCGNSGTTMRLLAGLLAGRGVNARLVGDRSLMGRPMKRVANPLIDMGADIDTEGGNAPIVIRPSRLPLRGISYDNITLSAQVKSAILLAGLNAEGTTTVYEKYPSRNHTEIMLKQMGAAICCDGVSIRKSSLSPCDITVPGDISSAAFLFALGAMLENSSVTVRGVGTNPTRSGILAVLRQMGAEVVEADRGGTGEPIADVTVSHRRLRGITIGGGIIPSLIDEIPIIAVMACLAEGETIICDAAELRVKETDRIAAIAENLTKMGAKIEIREDGMKIIGKRLTGGCVVDSFGDHRIAMAMAVAGLVSQKGVKITNADCTDISYPSFWEVIK